MTLKTGIAAAMLAASMLHAAPALADDSFDGSCTSGSGPRVTVNVVGLKDRVGRLKLELYPANEADFLKDDRDLRSEGKPFRRVWANTPQSGAVTLCIRAPSAGQWALLFTHDRDGKNKFNFWQDGAGFVSAQRIGRSRPKVGQARITVGPGGATVTVRAQYLRGLGGFSPMSD